jgi:hypothetical protein
MRWHLLPPHCQFIKNHLYRHTRLLFLAAIAVFFRRMSDMFKLLLFATRQTSHDDEESTCQLKQ